MPTMFCCRQYPMQDPTFCSWLPNLAVPDLAGVMWLSRAMILTHSVFFCEYPAILWCYPQNNCLKFTIYHVVCIWPQKVGNKLSVSVSICLPNFGFFPKIMRNESPATSTHCTSIKIRRDMHRYYTLDVTKSPKQFDQKCGRQSHLVHWPRCSIDPWMTV